MEENVLQLYEKIKHKYSVSTLKSANSRLNTILQENTAAEKGKFLSPQERHDLISLMSGITCYLELISYKNLDGMTFQEFYQTNPELCKKTIKPLVKAREYLIII